MNDAHYWRRNLEEHAAPVPKLRKVETLFLAQHFASQLETAKLEDVLEVARTIQLVPVRSSKVKW